MEYLLIGTLLGSIITSEHKNREACEGRATLLREAKASVQCVRNSSNGTFIIQGGYNGIPCRWVNNGTCVQ